MLTKQQRETLEVQANHYHAQLDQVIGYLESRGISRSTCDEFRLGFVGEPLSGDEGYQGRISIPYIKPSGVVDIRFRATENSAAKYLSRPGSDVHLYNTSALLSAHDSIAITEGEFDCLILHQLGIDAVGVPGVHNWQDEWRRLFNGFRRVVIFGDGDDAGKKFSAKLARQLRGIAVHMPDDMDVTDVYGDPDYGPDWLKERVYG